MRNLAGDKGANASVCDELGAVGVPVVELSEDTEGDAMIVGADGVSWTAGPRREDGWVTTREIPYAVLLDPDQNAAS